MQYVVFLPTMTESPHNFESLLEEVHLKFPEMKPVRLGSIGEELDERAWIAAVCLGISKQTYEADSLHVVAFDKVVNRLPDIAFANRVAHRTIHSYTFVDCLPDTFLPDWPDAPVTLVITNPLSTLGQRAKLRGWDVKVVDDVLKLPQVLADTLQNYAL